MTDRTLVSCDGCMLGYPASEMHVAWIRNGERIVVCRECAKDFDDVEPYAAPPLPGQQALPQALMGNDEMKVEPWE